MLKALTLPLLFTVFIHGLLVAFIVIDMPDSSPLVKKVTPSYVKARLVTIDKPKPKPKKKVKKPKKKKPVDNSATRKKEKQQKLAEQRKKEQEKNRIKEQKEQERLIQEQLQREQEEKQREELRRESELDLADAIAMENAEQQSESDDDLAMSYTALISTRITENWSRPPSARNNMEAELVLSLVPTGEVVSVSVVKSSGNSAFDRSAEQAVKKTGQFPELQDVPARVFEKYFRQFRLKFRPEDLRL